MNYFESNAVLQLSEHPKYSGVAWMDVIFDVSGTLLDISHRLKHIRKTPKDWKNFRDPDLKKFDEPRSEIISILRALHNAGHTVILASGRVESERNVTISTLLPYIHFIHDLPFFMRSEGDFRKDIVLKESMLYKMKENGYHPVMVFDDNPSIIRMWRNNGLVVADVGPGEEF